MALAIERVQFLEERKQAEIAKRSAEFKAALLASLAHDLRTPLTAIRVAAENLQAAGKILGGLFQPPKDEPAATQSDHKSDHMASEISKIELEKQAVI